jgi:hypothetical protein
VIGIGCGEFTRTQPPCEFALVERPVVVAIETRKQSCRSLLDLAEIKRSVRIQIEHLDRIIRASGQR